MKGNYTSEQEKLVLKILSYKNDRFYDILSVDKNSSQEQIKKSYRKLAVKLHPDKNHHPKSGDAFKIINKAWKILGDPKKKVLYDQTGQDPESQSSGAGMRGEDIFRGFGNGQKFSENGGLFNEDIFSFFFDNFGGMNTRPGFTFRNGSFFFQQFDTNNERFTRKKESNKNEKGNRRNSLYDNIRHLLPIIIFLVVPLISSFFSDSTSIPDHSFIQSYHYRNEKFTPQYKIPFYVSDKVNRELKNHKKAYYNYDLMIEKNFIKDKKMKCTREKLYRNELIEEATGWFYTDYKKINKVKNMKMHNCEYLSNLNIY